jgi:hypothetical protein
MLPDDIRHLVNALTVLAVAVTAVYAALRSS